MSDQFITKTHPVPEGALSRGAPSDPLYGTESAANDSPVNPSSGTRTAGHRSTGDAPIDYDSAPIPPGRFEIKACLSKRDISEMERVLIQWRRHIDMAFEKENYHTGDSDVW